MLDWAQLTLFIYITARMSGCILFNPILGRTNITNVFRSGMVLVLSVFVYSFTDLAVAVPATVIELALHIMLELFVGFVLGMVMQFFFYIPQMAGLTIDTQMGLTMSQMYDAGSQANMSFTAQLLNVLMILLFFAANGHHTLLEIMLTSGDVVGYGAASFGTELYAAMLELFAECTLLAIKMGLPILAAELLGQLGMGILMKVIPQINVFTINIDLKVIIGLVLMLMFLSPFSEFLLQIERDMLASVRNALNMLS